MIKELPLKILSFLCLATLVASAHGNSIAGLENTIQRIYEQKSSAIVRVKAATVSTNTTGQEETSVIVFSGFFISSDGKVLSNATPKDASRVWIEKDGISYLAEVIGTDHRTNISLLQVVSLPTSFDFIEIAEQAPQPKIGSFAFSISGPINFGPSPNFGLVTGFESQFDDIVFPVTYTRLSIAIGPAEGGSPVFNSSGEFIGASMATIPEVRSSYIMPPKTIQRLINDFQESGEAQYGSLPFELAEKVDRVTLKSNITVTNIQSNSSAFHAGIQKGDIISKIDGANVHQINEVRNAIFFKEIGTYLPLTIQRNDQLLNFNIQIVPSENSQ